MTGASWVAIGVLLTLAIFISNVIFRTGHLAARVEEIERWRADIRKDMHEISDKMELINNNLMNLSTLIEERTERRLAIRGDK